MPALERWRREGREEATVSTGWMATSPAVVRSAAAVHDSQPRVTQTLPTHKSPLYRAGSTPILLWTGMSHDRHMTVT